MKTCAIDDCGKKHFARGMCETHYNAARYMKTREYRKGRALARYYADHEKTRSDQRKYAAVYRAKNPSEARARSRRGMGMPEYTRAESAVCEICGSAPNSKRALCLDHDHVTGAFRGWLCAKCNALLGMARDNPGILRAAISYLMWT
jgi:hypothetical protein